MALVIATGQLIGLPMIVVEFDLIGLGQWFRYKTAIVLIAGALLMLRHRTTAFGAGLLVAGCLGALITHILVLHGDMIHTLVPAVLFAVIAWTHRLSLPG